MCDFVEDCGDYSDEATRPTIYMFDDCKDNWGDKMCYWKESPVDDLDWIIARGNQYVMNYQYKYCLQV